VLKRINRLSTPRNMRETIAIPVPVISPSSFVVGVPMRLFQKPSNESKVRPDSSFFGVSDALLDALDVEVPAGPVAPVVPVAPVADILAYSLIR
jgi:hypothetical protein